MTYVAKTAAELRRVGGSLLQKVARELGAIDDEIDAHKSKFVVLTTGLGTPSALATSGVDIADGSGGTTYGVFFAPQALTVTKMHVLFTEAYALDTDAAVIALKDNAGTPATIFTYTPAAEGVAEGTMVSNTPETGAASIAAGTRLDLVITATAASTGTGHVIVILEYKEV
jgi:hypothetical protein